ncbi:MAG: RNA-binding protein, partial [Candidatus Saccharimonadaceae bacterium]
MQKQNLFVGSLAYATNDDSLKAFFEEVGPVSSARVITDRDSGRSKGFGFVEYEDDANNQKA